MTPSSQDILYATALTVANKLDLTVERYVIVVDEMSKRTHGLEYTNCGINFLNPKDDQIHSVEFTIQGPLQARFSEQYEEKILNILSKSMHSNTNVIYADFKSDKDNGQKEKTDEKKEDT